jgi:hypothetical protein
MPISVAKAAWEALIAAGSLRGGSFSQEDPRTCRDTGPLSHTPKLIF